MNATWPIRVPDELASDIDALVKRIADKEKINVSRSQVVIRLLRRGLAEETRKR